MKNTESTFKKDLEKLYFNTEGRFADMYDSDPVHFLNRQLELHLGRKVAEEDIDALALEKLPGAALLYQVKYMGSDFGLLSITKDSHDYQLRLHFKKNEI